MPRRKSEKITIVHEHQMHIPPSRKNPDGLTIRHQHPRRIYNSYTNDDLKKIVKNYRIKNIFFPTPNSLNYTDGNKYDKLIAIWVDHFNKIFPPQPPFSPLDPNIIKALLAGESEFKVNPSNLKAYGIAQITPSTLKILKNPNGEVKDFLFPKTVRADLLDPEINIAMGVRWLFYKKQFAEKQLKRPATPEEIVLAFKGLLKSKTSFKESALENFRKNYAILQKK